LGYIVDATPGRHTTSGSGIFSSLKKAFPELIPPPTGRWHDVAVHHAVTNHWINVTNALGLCMFSLLMRVPNFVELTHAVTGWELTPHEMMATGERIATLRHLFNLREGICNPRDFRLPGRAMGSPPLEDGPTEGVTLDMETMVQSYVDFMDWDHQTGVPSHNKLAQLGLDDLWAKLSVPGS
jgi:aldehyde:ferredoxin oxidoreductase